MRNSKSPAVSLRETIIKEEKSFMNYDYSNIEKDLCKTKSGKPFKEITDTDFQNMPLSEKEELMEWASLKEDLDSFHKWCNEAIGTENLKKESAHFSPFFGNALLGAYIRYYRSKKKAWSNKNMVIGFLCALIAPVLAAGILSVITAGIEIPLMPVGLLGAGIVVLIWFGTSIYSEIQKKHAYDETWVRHSACYGRLRLALSAFLVSSRTEKDFQTLVAKTFSVLEQNYDQFVLNLSQKGMAKVTIDKEK